MTRTGVQVRFRVQTACTIQETRESRVGGGLPKGMSATIVYTRRGQAQVGCLEYNRDVMRDVRADLRERWRGI
jgi:hypothetical protein